MIGRPACLGHGSYYLLAYLHYIAALQRKDDAVGLQTGHIQYVINQPKQQIRVGPNNLEIATLFFFRGSSGRQHVREAHNRIQWRTDFVAHIGKESTLQTAGFFGTVFCFAQGTLGYLQFILQLLCMIIKVKGNEQTAQQHQQNSTDRPDMILVLFVERRGYVLHLYRLRKAGDIQFLFLHKFTVQYGLIRNDFHMGLTILRGGQQAVGLSCHLLAQSTVGRNDTCHSPISQAYGTERESGQSGSCFHHGVGCIPHEVTIVHVHTPCPHQYSCIFR